MIRATCGRRGIPSFLSWFGKAYREAIIGYYIVQV